MLDLAPLVPRLKREEGLRLQVYDDATGAYIRPGSRVVGQPTIGIGCNVGPGAGITEAEADYLLLNRLQVAARDASTLPGFNHVSAPRQLVLVDMIFNMGAAKVRQFTGMLQALQAANFDLAAAHMLESLWARQVGTRARELAQIMRTGVWA